MFERPNFIFKVLSGGSQFSEQTKFKPRGLYLFLRKEIQTQVSHSQIVDAVQEFGFSLRGKISKGKGGADLVKELGDGSLISPYDTMADAIKNIDDILGSLDLSEQYGLWIDISAQDFYDKETEKYEFENAKKPSTVEDLEDAYFKLFADKKSVVVISDPFIGLHAFAWHKLNVSVNYIIAETASFKLPSFLI